MTSSTVKLLTPLLATLLFAALLLVACGDALEADAVDPEGAASPSATPTASPAAPTTPTPPATTTPEPPPISAVEFCEQAQLSITRWELPPVLTDQIERGSIELRYRLPPGAETLIVWMGATIEVGSVTFGDVFGVDPSLRAMFPNADPEGVIPATIPSHGFDLEFDSQTHTIEVPITFPPEANFDATATWRWSRLSPPPFVVGEPWVLATFRADGVRVRMDGQHCTPVIPPLP